MLENNQFELYWDIEIWRDVETHVNRSDILRCDKEKDEVDITDVVVPLDHNLQSHMCTRK
jgi:hypothetical protein